VLDEHRKKFLDSKFFNFSLAFKPAPSQYLTVSWKIKMRKKHTLIS
jgi:hypothetical protein